MVVVDVHSVGIVLLAISSIHVTNSFAIPLKPPGGIQDWSFRGNTPAVDHQVVAPGDEPSALALAFQNGDDATATKLLTECDNLDLLEEGVRLFTQGESLSWERADQGSGPDIVALALATAAMESGDVLKFSKLAARLASQKGGDLGLLESLFYDAFLDKRLLKRIVFFGQGATNRRILLGKGKRKRKKDKRKKKKRDGKKNRKKKEEAEKKKSKKSGDFEFQCADCKPVYNHVACALCLPSEECKSRAWCKQPKN